RASRVLLSPTTSRPAHGSALFPYTTLFRSRSIEESGRLEEERRLAYVGITRARHKLVLSYAESRRLHGQDMYGVPSRFLREIPSDRKSTRLNSSHVKISYAVFCLKKKKTNK